MCAFISIGIQASGLTRHAFYEAFKSLHTILTILSLIGVYYHLRLKDLPHAKYLITAVTIWVADHILRTLRIGYHNFRIGRQTTAMVKALPGDACVIQLSIARPWDVRPGQFAYVYFPTLSYWQSHPFSVAWIEEPTEEPENHKCYSCEKQTDLSFIVRSRTGFTKTLYRMAANCQDRTFQVACIVEGPYGGLSTFHSYGTVILFAGGVGITHQLLQTRELIRSHSTYTAATKKINLIWIIQSLDYMEWIRPWVAELLAMEQVQEVLRITLFETGPQSKEIYFNSEMIQVSTGRPKVRDILQTTIDEQVGAMAVSVCGPGSLTDDVRRAVRDCQYDSTIDFFEESFS
jgi:predicted ferric reductase